MKLFNPLEHPVCLDFPHWLVETSWAEHIPFAMFLVSALKPKVIVELGTWCGVSYCAFCQAVKTLKINTKCYAVDTWEGDDHAGKIEAVVLTKLKSHHDPLYSDFSRLVQSTFDNALENFADYSIDLLHIDGFHTYEVAKHDFDVWLPKMSEHGVVLLHDINVREQDFGVWKLWTELTKKYPNFEFIHNHGIGVLAVGKTVPEGLRHLLEADESEALLIRKTFHALGERFGAVQTVASQAAYIDRLKTYEEVVNDSRVMRAYRILKDEGFGVLLKKARSKKQ